MSETRCIPAAGHIHVQPAMTRTRTCQIPDPCMQVWVLVGTGTGSPKKPAVDPCRSLVGEEVVDFFGAHVTDIKASGAVADQMVGAAAAVTGVQRG
jgi:hypothetical protein